MTSSAPPPSTSPAAIATARTPGIDVARALAIFGMVLVNYRSKTDAVGPEWLSWMTDRVEGRAAALFVLLAGVGISLRSKRARQDPAKHLAYERGALLKRAIVLFAAGLMLMHLWEWDILHSYGVFLAVAALLLRAPAWVLGILAFGCVAGQIALQTHFVYDMDLLFWTLEGAASDLAFNGLHPFFPWMAFLLVGMWVGRIDLNRSRPRRRLLAASLVVAVLAEGMGAVAGRAPQWLGITEDAATWLCTWPRPPVPTFVLAAGGSAMAVLMLAIEATHGRAHRGWVVVLTVTGQLALTHYLTHVGALLIPMQHGLFWGRTLAWVAAYAVAFCLLAVAGSYWWRRRRPYGPFEGLIRQITGRTTPAPWGGKPLDPG